MSDFQAFDSLDEMYEFMHANEEAANQTLAPEQRAVTYDDYWVRFYDIANRVVIFGHVTPLTYWDEAIANAKGDEDRAEWEFEKNQIEDSHGRGYMYGWCWSTIEPDGEPGSTHQANLWPVSRELFEAAREVHWDIDAMTPPDKMRLQVAYQVWRAHQASLRRPS